jgi:hypothetical protein
VQPVEHHIGSRATLDQGEVYRRRGLLQRRVIASPLQYVVIRHATLRLLAVLRGHRWGRGSGDGLNPVSPVARILSVDQALKEIANA